MIDKDTLKVKNKRIRLVTKTLNAAIKLWLRTQLDKVSHIETEIGASDRQLLSGCIPSISISAKDAVYQGIHVTSIQLQAENIQINIGGILKGKPLRLLEVVPIVGELVVKEQDLNYSLTSKLLSQALNDLLLKFLPNEELDCEAISWKKCNLENQNLTLTAILAPDSENTHLEMTAGLKLINTQEIQLSPIKIKHNQIVIFNKNDGYKIDMGSDVAF
ncbi:MAG: DUF2993 domain-containing protein [Sphaerospermopsis sp. SIO1G2]|nr:DUF2993 domain-containing protein [Sphaerospermopsis sp. SIO1G2]